jgi:type I restriction-modification system DNA methylase subunit
MMNQELAYTEIEKLITNFKNMPAAQRKGLNEMQTRLGYILPMFKALGWDTSNINEVSPEEKVSRGWVDFSFRVGNVPRFFLETKRANEDLNDPRWVQQAIDYAWTKSVTWALLSDFEGLRVFNAEWKESDPFRAQFFEFGLDDYLKDFERLWWLSKQETISRRLDIEAEKVGRKIKRLPVSQNLFDDLKRWRENLFKNYKAFNLGYSAAQIDESVLRLLNRLIFIRTAEDREVEENRLQSLVRVLKDKKQIQTLDRELASLFRELDGVYNSELFARHFSEELQIPPTELQEIINGLYEKNYTRYNFNALEADVLGTAYEQYLGHIVAEGETETHVEEKRTKRKSQGIYYTPTFVTKYIVQQTVGKYLDENGYNPSKPPRVLDMACGSGSFLIEAFDVVDNFVAKQRGQAQKGEVDFYDRARQLEVLQSCIFGVDKDKQAVEVARLNLLLRGLHSREKLPMLENIHYADSLKPETWDWDFSQATKDGGFDVIIGNPPYIRFENLPESERENYANSGVFKTAYQKFDIYVLFLERAISLLKPGGRIGFIIPSAILNQIYAMPLRKLILETGCIENIVDFSGYKVFQDATVETCVLVIKKTSDEKTRKENRIAIVPKGDFSDGIIGKQTIEIGQKTFETTPQNMFRLDIGDSIAPLVKKIENQSVNFGDLFYVSKGIVAYTEDGRKKSDFLHKKKAKKNFVPYLEGKDVQRYVVEFKELYLDYQPSIMARPTFQELHESPKILVRAIAQGLLGTYDEAGFYADQKLICCVQYKLLNEQRQVKLPENYSPSNKYSDCYALGLLNSKLLLYYYRTVLFNGLSILPEHIRRIPVHRINFENQAEKTAHDEITKLVEKMLVLQKERQAVRPEDDLDNARNLDRRIKEVDSEIDKRVFKLYGLSDEEIKIVEAK